MVRRPKNLIITFGSADCLTFDRFGAQLAANDVDVDQLLDDIGIDYVMEYFDLIKRKEHYGVSNEDF